LSSRKAQNSILFLTTLGVYLGLLMVGGSVPQVFAHSATNRHFEITDEIEIKDDLDNKPDDERSPVKVSIENYLDDVELFISSLHDLQKRGLFDPTRETFAVGQSTELPCIPANKIGSYTVTEFATSDENARDTLEWFSKRLTDGYSLGDCLPNSRFEATQTHDSKFRVKLDRSLFSIEVAIKKASPREAVLLAADLQNTFRNLKIASANAARLRIYENTTFRSENDQIFIITRLPRAGLESLLASNA
jgi:hypothetical protein